MGVRGFLPVRALPPRGLADPRGRLRGRSTRQILDHFRIGCSQRDSTSVPASATPEPKVHASLVSVFDWNDRYSGSGGVRDAGSRLVNYQGWPDPKQDLPGPPGPVPLRATGRADIVREVKVMQSTTGIEGGGIVRAIVPASSRFVELDHFAYRDPNVLCSPAGQGRVEAAEVVQWMYVRVVGTGIEAGRRSGRSRTSPAAPPATWASRRRAPNRNPTIRSTGSTRPCRTSGAGRSRTCATNTVRGVRA